MGGREERREKKRLREERGEKERLKEERRGMAE